MTAGASGGEGGCSWGTRRRSSTTRAPRAGAMVMLRILGRSDRGLAARSSVRSTIARRTIPISDWAKAAPTQRRTPPPKGIQLTDCLVPQAPEDPEAGGCGRQRGCDSPAGCGIPLRLSEGKCEVESVTAIGGSVGKAGSTQAVAVIEGEQRHTGEDHVTNSREAGQRQASLVRRPKTESGEDSTREGEYPNADRQTSHCRHGRQRSNVGFAHRCAAAISRPHLQRPARFWQPRL
jgi:hypothetical protein